MIFNAPEDDKIKEMIKNEETLTLIKERKEMLETLHKPLNGMYTVNDERHGEITVTKHVYNLVMKDRLEACAQRTPEWYAKRMNHVTASMMATVCNANPYETRSSAVKRKTGVERPFTGNAATAHGNKYEMEAILKYEALTGAKCLEFGLLESLNENEEFLAGSPDGITSTGRLIEVKCPFRRTPTEKVPDYYFYQIQFLMHTLKLKDCDFIQYVPEGIWTGETFIVTRVKYDPYFWYAKLPSLKAFWDEVIDIRKRKAQRNRNKRNNDDDDDEEENEDDDDNDDGGGISIGGNTTGKLVINIELDEKDKKLQANKKRKSRNGIEDLPCLIDF